MYEWSAARRGSFAPGIRWVRDSVGPLSRSGRGDDEKIPVPCGDRTIAYVTVRSYVDMK
jgi:hypothetical protein